MKESSANYGYTDDTIIVKCSHCGSYNGYNKEQLKNNTEKAKLILNPPKNLQEMKKSILSVLKRIYPRGAGYNGSHLEPLDTHNREMFFSALRQLEDEELIKYTSDTFMRLTDKYFELEKLY